MKTKYRGKRKDGGGWVRGYYRFDGVDRHEIMWLFKPSSRTISWKWLFDEVTPESVGQWTGRNDSKDTEMYAGDIIEFTYWWFDGNIAEATLTGTIVYANDLMSFQLKGVKNKEWEKFTGYENDQDYLTPFSELSFDEADFSVIGNLTDNPELIPGGKDENHNNHRRERSCRI